MTSGLRLAGLTAPVLMFLLVSPAPAQSGAPPVRACAAAEYHQFDFWLGEWNVTLPDGKVAGSNRIESIMGGCVVRESWTGARGHQGTSYNIYDASHHRWHQTWVDDQGNLLELDGRFSDARMALTGETIDSAGNRTLQRITWQETAPGKVRQLWESSNDGGKTWTVAFDGRYTKR